MENYTITTGSGVVAVRDPVRAYRARLGRAIREARAAADTGGWPEADFCEAAGITTSTLWRIESGAVDVRLETLCRLADALGTTPAGLLAAAEGDA